MDANGSCGCDAGTGFVAMQNLPESEDDDEEEGDEEIEVQTRRELRSMQLFYAVLHEFMMTGCMLAFFLCLIMHDMHVHFQRVSIATCCHHVGFCGTAGHAGLDLCPVEAPSATERKVSFSQATLLQPDCSNDLSGRTLSPIIMVQWKIGPLNERTPILEIHPFSSEP